MINKAVESKDMELINYIGDLIAALLTASGERKSRIPRKL
jgi:hypothetical protein